LEIDKIFKNFLFFKSFRTYDKRHLEIEAVWKI